MIEQKYSMGLDRQTEREREREKERKKEREGWERKKIKS